MSSFASCRCKIAEQRYLPLSESELRKLSTKLAMTKPAHDDLSSFQSLCETEAELSLAR